MIFKYPERVKDGDSLMAKLIKKGVCCWCMEKLPKIEARCKCGHKFILVNNYE